LEYLDESGRKGRVEARAEGPMREELKKLIELQRLDATIRNLQDTRQKLTRDAADVQRGAEEAKRALQDRTESHKSTRKEMDKREVDLKTVEEKITRLETQLNVVKTNKEYSALQHEILGLKADKSRVEDDILKMMEQLEARNTEIKQADQKSQEAEAKTKEKKAAIQNALQDAEARIERLHGERAALAESIPASFLTPYERLLQRGDGRAMVPCRNFVCSGCRMSLTANTVSLLMGGDKLVYCHSCGRILYLADDEDMTNIATAGRREN
jgi:predicted  nucleic acid-binding Zn-ribbon protein